MSRVALHGLLYTCVARSIPQLCVTTFAIFTDYSVFTEVYCLKQPVLILLNLINDQFPVDLIMIIFFKPVVIFAVAQK